MARLDKSGCQVAAMVFTSEIFVFYFLPAVLLIYYLLPGRRNVFLLGVSYIFYRPSGPRAGNAAGIDCQ